MLWALLITAYYTVSRCQPGVVPAKITAGWLIDPTYVRVQYRHCTSQTSNNTSDLTFTAVYAGEMCGRIQERNMYSNIYIQQDATLNSSFYLETALHVSGGTSTHHQERKQLYLQHLVFVRPLLLPAAMAAGSSNGLTNTRCCRYSCLRSWWWVEVPPDTCRAVSR